MSVLEFLKKHKKTILCSTLTSVVFASWYCSDISNKEHHPSFLKKPKNSENYFQNKRNLWINTREWPTLKKPIALLFLVHGHGEHISRKGYDVFASFLNKAGIAVFGLDHEGHGLSNGSRGHVMSIDNLSDDLEQYIQSVFERFPGIPSFAVGHSMGGVILVNTVLRHPKLFLGIILSAPATCAHLDPQFSEVSQFMANVLTPILPKLDAIKLPLDGLSRNPDAVKAYLADPLIGGGYINLLTGSSILEKAKEMYEKLTTITLPVLIIHGEEDTIVNPICSDYLYSKLGSPDKKFLNPSRVKHELWEDPDRKQFFEEIIHWITQHNEKLTNDE